MSTSLFGCLVSWQPSGVNAFNGLKRANEDFLRAIVRYSHFDELHLFLLESHIQSFQESWHDYLDSFGAGKNIRLIPSHELPKYLESHHYTVMHCGDPYISDLAALRERHAEKLFPITGRAHSLSDDARLSRVRDLIFAPVKACDAVLCSSQAQKKVMNRLLSSASATFSDTMGVAFPYRGRVDFLPLGVEIERQNSLTPEEARKQLGLPEDKAILLCLGRLSPSDKMDLHPLLFALNDLHEEGRANDFLLVVAGAGDASSPYMQSLLKHAYELNLEDHLHFELSVDDDRKSLLYRASDIFVSLADNVQESFGLAPVEAMNEGLAVVLSDWNGYRELVEDGESGYLVKTLGSDQDGISRSVSLLNRSHANFLQAQSVALDFEALGDVLDQLIQDKPLRESVGRAARARVAEHFSWKHLVAQYHELVQLLNKEAGSVRHHRSREVGMPYNSVFGHYPSRQLDEKTQLLATDRGIRVLLKSEGGFLYQELRYLLDKQQIRSIIKAAIQPVTCKVLLERFSDIRALTFVLSWMVKYQLLKTVSEDYKSQAGYCRVINLPEVELEETESLSFPEQRRSELLKPVVAQCLQLSQQYLQGCDVSGGGLQTSLATEWIKLLDERLLQALTWFSQEQEIKAYGEIIDALNEKGGLDYLIHQYPLWYRNVRREIFNRLKVVKRLGERVSADLPDINFHFSEDDQPASGLISIQCLGYEAGWKTLKLSFDNSVELVYKTRDLNVDTLLVGQQGSIAEAVNGWLGQYPGLGTHEILAKAGYGYARYLQKTPVSEEELTKYHQHLGVTLGFSLLTGLADIHHLNVLNVSGVPHLIDLETVLHAPVFMNLERELSNPELGFLRGMDEASLGKTGLRNLWESFHTTRVNHCSSRLLQGELVEAEPLECIPVADHLLKQGERHSLDGIKPNLSGLHAKALLEGFERVLEAVASHSDEWAALLQQMAGLEVRYHPLFNLNSVRKQLRDLYTSDVFQKMPDERIHHYFSRLARRVTLEGEVSQRWLDEEWRVPTGRLAEAMAKGWQQMEERVLVHCPGEAGIYVRTLSGKRLPVIDEAFFEVNALEKAKQLAECLAEDEGLRRRFLDACGQMLESWLAEQLVPGAETPAEIRNSIKSGWEEG